MKESNKKKIFTGFAVLALSATLAMGAAACGGNGDGNDNGDNGGAEPIVGKTYYISADATADGTGESISDPTSIALLNSTALAAGDTIYLLPGTYNWNSGWRTHNRAGDGIVITASGAPNGNIKIINAAYDENSGYTGGETKVTLNFSQMLFDGNNRGVSLYGNYIYWYGIDVCGAGDNGLYIGGSYNTVEYCDFYNNRDTGLQLGRSESGYNSINQWPSFNLVKNCTSHNNYDDETYGENADGFAAKLTVGYGNVFDGCIAYRNSDDGWDLFAKTESGNIGCVIIYNCVAFENGYLEYTQEEMHQILNYNRAYDEPVTEDSHGTNSYMTRDGDGNGFKLGGSVMEGDVKMYNCLAFQNRMHGVTDNSNPGYLKIEGVTSYDNSAIIDNNPESEYFGQVVRASGEVDTHGNINVARQDFSYNTVKNTLSVKSSVGDKAVENDEYRGSVIDSLLNAGSKTNVVKGTIDADTKVDGGAQYTEQINALKAEDVFKKLPVVMTTTEEGTAYTYNISGLKDSDNAVANRVHDKYRNADHSINMGEILAVKADFDFTPYLGSGVKAGSYLDKTSWEDYSHFTADNLFDGVDSEIVARLLKAKETLTINSDESAVYQDFEVPIMLASCTIDWSSDSELLTVGKLIEHSISNSEYVTVGVTRPTDADQTVTLTATISYLNRSITKEFELIIKKDVPSIGSLIVRVPETNEVYGENGKVIMDLYRQFSEPVLEVENGAYYNGTLLTEAQYTVKTVYEYAASASAEFVPVAAFTPNHAGVYRITHNVTLNGSDENASLTYQIFVAATFADVDFDGEASVSVFRDGYIIAGPLTNVTGTLYTVSSETALTDISVDNIKTYEGVESNDFRATDISFGYDNANVGGYHIYFALANVEGNVTSQLYHVEITAKEVSTKEDFVKIAGGSKLGSETVSHTIYLLTQDLDFTGYNYNPGTSAFTGLLNGQGHTISGITREGTADNTGVFSQVTGGTIMNLKLNDIKLSGGQRTAIVARTYGGYFHNIAITNLYVYGSSQRTGGLIGQAYEGATNTEITQVSLVNPIPVLTFGGEIDETAEDNQGQLYYISGSGNRVGGIIGFIQTNNPIRSSLHIVISDCYVSSYLHCGGSGIGSIVAEYDENGQMVNVNRNGYEFILEINNCVSAGVLVNTGTGRVGGMLGYHKGTGNLRIVGCLSIQNEYYKGALIRASQKNQSPTIGGFSTAEVVVSNCIALMEEYNTDYEVSTYSDYVLSLGKEYKEDGDANWIDVAGFDMETKWSYVYDDEFPGETRLAAPYIMLNFLES